MNIHDWEHIALQMFAIADLALQCNKCNKIKRFGVSALSFAANIADTAGWTVGDDCQVCCPKCNAIFDPERAAIAQKEKG